MDRTPRPPRKLSPVLTVILALGGVLLLLCCGGGYLLIRYVGPYQAAGDLPEAVAAYRQTGLPWEAKDLSPQPPVSKDKNAASLVNRCTLALNQKSLGKGIENISQLSEKGQFAEAEKGLIPFAEVMKLGEQAARLGRADFGHDWDQGPNVLSPELLTFKEVCKLLAARAQLEAAHGQVGSAIQDLRNARKIGDLASQNEGLIPMLVQIAIGSISCRAEQHCAELWAQDAAALRRLDALEGENQSEPDFLHALRGEAYMSVATCRNLKAMGGIESFKGDLSGDPDSAPQPIDPSKLQRTGLPSDAISRGMMDRCLRFWVGAHNLTEVDKGDPQRLSKDLDRLSEKYSNIHSTSDILATVLTPVYSQAGDAVVKLKATRLVTKALVLAMVIHTKTGKFPTSLSQIPGEWKDPFNGQPLQLKVSEGGIRIYSVGPDGQDDGGVTTEELPKGWRAGTSRWDIAAAYPMPKKP